MRFSLLLVIASTLHCALGAQLIHVFNNCTETVNFSGSLRYQWRAKTHIAWVEAGHNYTYELQQTMEFANGPYGKTRVFIEVDIPYQNFYLVDVRFGFDTGVQVTATKGNGVITCRSAHCLRLETKGYTILPGGDFTITYCP